MIKNWLFYIYNLYIKAELCFEHKQNYSCGNFELTKSAVKKNIWRTQKSIDSKRHISTIGSSWDDIGVNDFSDIKKNIDLITMAMTAMKRQIRGFLLASFTIMGWVDQISNIYIKCNIFGNWSFSMVGWVDQTSNIYIKYDIFDIWFFSIVGGVDDWHVLLCKEDE